MLCKLYHVSVVFNVSGQCFSNQDAGDVKGQLKIFLVFLDRSPVLRFPRVKTGPILGLLKKRKLKSQTILGFGSPS